MKKIILIVFVLTFLVGCDTGKGKEQQKDSDTVSIKQDDHIESSGKLQLNKGAKWKIDSVTAINVGSLKTIVAEAKQSKPSNYTVAAAKLQDGLNKLITECKMKGADHDALHHWLEPVIENTKELKSVETEEKGAIILSNINHDLDLFDQYFEL